MNRLMYGERDDPYAVISRLGRRLEAAIEPEAVLPTVVETIAQALKLPYVAVLLEEDGQFRTAASYGSSTAEPEVLPLVYQREEIGRLVLSPRSPGEGFSDSERDLLGDLARQTEVAVHAVRLTADLQRSREPLVATREEERRRLRRDLHDGLGAQLAGLNVQAGAQESVFMALRAGARGYVLKDADEEEMVLSIRAVGRGEAIFSPAVATRVLAYFSKPAAPPQVFPTLTDREREILNLIAQGHPNPSIAKHLSLSTKTVGNYVSNIFTKLQVADRAQAIIRAREAGMG